MSAPRVPTSPAPRRGGHLRPASSSHPWLVGGAVAAAAMAGAAVVNHRLARRAERDNPPIGQFVDIDGVRLHYVDRGEGEALVLLHGNGSMVEDFLTSGLLDAAARSYRVIALDRPGYGHSERPRGTMWTPSAQADLLREALARIGVRRATVLGHSWGCCVAVQMALRHPEFVSGLVLASGYYYPGARLDVIGMSGPAVPVLGDVMRYTASPIVARLLWPVLLRKVFGPEPVPGRFRYFPKEMALRPSQIRASAAESAMMIPAAMATRDAYRELSMPVSIIAGERDRIVEASEQSARLHHEIAHSTFDCIPGAGHMIHQTATARVLAAVHRAAATPRHSAGQR